MPAGGIAMNLDRSHWPRAQAGGKATAETQQPPTCTHRNNLSHMALEPHPSSQDLWGRWNVAQAGLRDRQDDSEGGLWAGCQDSAKVQGSHTVPHAAWCQ